MSQVFVRVELRGTPGEDVYARLHADMKSKNWDQTITGAARTSNLPHAMYQGTFKNDVPDLAAIAKGLREHIEATIWRKAIVLVIRSAGWAQSAG
jgi:hypothetical protein